MKTDSPRFKLIQLRVKRIINNSLNSQRAARPVLGRCLFDSVFRPLPLFRISRPKMFIIFKFDFLTNGVLRFFMRFL